MQNHGLPKEKQPDAVSDQLPGLAPSLWLYVYLITIAFLLIAISFSMRVDWPGLLLNLAASLIAAIVLLILVDRRLRASEVGQIRSLPRRVGLRSLLLVSPRHRQLHAYTSAFLSILEAKLRSKIAPDSLPELVREAQKSFMLLGDPGTGKTTRLQMLAAHLARDFLKHQSPKVPVVFPLRLWLSEQSLQDALFKHVESFASTRRRSILRTLQQGKAIVMLDGLDELSVERTREFSGEFARLRAEYPAVTWIISARHGILPEIDDLPRIDLPPLTSDEMQLLARIPE